MSTPVVTDKWAGNFDCDFCRRKRLVGEEFSKKALEKYRKTGGKLKCKQCVQQQEEAERKAAAAKREKEARNNSNANSSDEKLKCKSCEQELDATQYNKNQWSKGPGKARCRSCVETALQEEQHQQATAKQNKVDDARRNVETAKASGNAAAILKAESELAALEAEKVTGLKPVRMNRGGGSGRGRGRGRNRSGSGRGRAGR